MPNTVPLTLENIFGLYIITHAIKKYSITMPDLSNIYALTLAMANYNPTDSTYTSLPEDARKNAYKGYLLGQNPTDGLLSINSNKKVWSDVGNYFKAQYDLNLFDTKIAPNYCVKVDSPKVIPNATQIDCRNASSSSTDIVGSSGGLFSGMGGLTEGNTGYASSACSSSSCCCTCVAVIIVLFVMFGMKKKGRR